MLMTNRFSPRRALLKLLAALLVAAALSANGADTNAVPAKISRRFDQLVLDLQKNPPAPGAVVCIGSSQMARWKAVAKDLAPLRVYNHGIGGSRMAQAADLFIPKLAIPFKPRAVILYEGSNDIAGGVTPEGILEDFKRLHGKLHDALPGTRLYVLGIVPSPGKRFEKISEVKRANALLQQECSLYAWMKFIDTTSPLIGADGLPRSECFIPGNIHMTEAGYAVWKATIRPVVLAVEKPFEN